MSGDLFGPTRPGDESELRREQEPPIVLTIAYHPDVRRAGEIAIVNGTAS